MLKLKKKIMLPGWPRIASGIDIIVWSRLASWNGTELKAATDQNAFNLHWPNVDEQFGRWLCWLAFGVGAESIVKGAFGLQNCELKKFGGDLPWNALKIDEDVREFVATSIQSLATEVRNRDAHEYVPGVRDIDFPDVELKFIPALNHVLNCLGKEKVRLEVAQLSRQ